MSSYNTGRGRPKNSGVKKQVGKCDVRLDKNEVAMLDHLAETNGVTRSDVMRKALKNYYIYNTEE